MEKALMIVKFPVDIHAKLKAKAAIKRVPLRELIIKILTEASEKNN